MVYGIWYMIYDIEIVGLIVGLLVGLLVGLILSLIHIYGIKKWV
jgi:hypothetical protein